MGDRITWFENCPNCGGENTVECYEALSSNIKMKDCEKCDWNMRYDFEEKKHEVKITPIYPNLVTPKAQLASTELYISGHSRRNGSTMGQS